MAEKAKKKRWQPWLLKDRSPSKWIREHERLLGLIGALVVFLTFVFKEGVKERAKDLGDALRSERNRYQSEEGMRPLIREIHETFRTTQFLMEAVRGKVIRELPEFKDTIWLEAKYAKEEAEGLKRLNERLSGQDETGRKLTHLSERFENIYEMGKRIPEAMHRLATGLEMEIGTVWRQKSSTRPSTRSKSEMSKEEIQREIEEVEQTFPLAKVLDEDEFRLDEIRDKVISLAQKESDSWEHWLGIWTYVSYGLYVLGWTLAFAGRLAGAKVGGGEE